MEKQIWLERIQSAIILMALGFFLGAGFLGVYILFRVFVFITRGF